MKRANVLRCRELMHRLIKNGLYILYMTNTPKGEVFACSTQSVVLTAKDLALRSIFTALRARRMRSKPDF